MRSPVCWVEVTKPTKSASTIGADSGAVGLVEGSLPDTELRGVSLDRSLLGIERTVPVGYGEMLASIGR